jgi:uncharacterized membrane protein
MTEFPEREKTMASNNSMTGKSCGSGCDVNVGEHERQLSMMVGGGLLLTSLLFARSRNIVSSLIGLGLIYRGLTGSCQLYNAMGVTTAEKDDFSPTPVAGSRAREIQHS